MRLVAAGRLTWSRWQPRKPTCKNVYVHTEKHLLAVEKWTEGRAVRSPGKPCPGCAVLHPWDPTSWRTLVTDPDLLDLPLCEQYSHVISFPRKLCTSLIWPFPPSFLHLFSNPGGIKSLQPGFHRYHGAEAHPLFSITLGVKVM